MKMQGRLISLLLLSFTCGSALADMTVHTEDWPVDDQRMYYPPRQVPMPDQRDEKTHARQTTPVRETTNYYLRIRINSLSQEVKELTNNAIAPSPLAGRTLTNNEDQFTKRNAEFAIGYAFPRWRGEVEFLFNRDFEFSSPTAVTGGVANFVPPPAVGQVNANQRLTSNIENSSLLFNAYYDFVAISIFKPYVFGTLGISLNSANTKLGGGIGQELKTNKYAIAYGFGLGTRIPVYQNVSMDFAYRWVDLGNLTMRTAGSVVDINAKRTISGPSAGIVMFL